MKKTTSIFSALFATLFIVGSISAHEHHQSAAKDTVAQAVSSHNGDSVMQQKMDEHAEMGSVNAFPNYHPLIVHFPIVLLLLAAVFQLLSFFLSKKEFSIVTIGLLSFGVITAWLASNAFHAHPAALTGDANTIFETHEQMASLTWWFSLAGLIIKLASHFFFERKLWVESIASVLMIASGVTVSIAGHHGSMLVHMKGIGPMGKFLESEQLTSQNQMPVSVTPMKPEIKQEVQTTVATETNHHVGELGKGPHGGTIQEADPYHIEVVADGKDLVFYLLDGDAKPLNMKKVTGSVKMRYSNNASNSIELMEMGGKLTAMQANETKPYTAICKLTTGGKSYSASFSSAKDLPVKK